MRSVAVGLIGLGVVAVAGPAYGQSPDRLCASREPAVAVENCSIVIRAGRGGPIAQAGFLTNRGQAYVKLRRYDEALRDYNEAVKLLPGDPDGYFLRAVLH
ncbi:MAG: tetratricopeptide repeat protein [Alphaproteobacteria bacterium]|nr:tetratricopeptide repeat protein [Alphaproteobacteria bacterium]